MNVFKIKPYLQRIEFMNVKFNSEINQGSGPFAIVNCEIKMMQWIDKIFFPRIRKRWIRRKLNIKFLIELPDDKH